MTGRSALTRRGQFAAAHHYRRPGWDDAQNAQLYGICSRVQARLPASVRVTRVIVAEDATLSSTFEPN